MVAVLLPPGRFLEAQSCLLPELAAFKRYPQKHSQYMSCGWDQLLFDSHSAWLDPSRFCICKLEEEIFTFT